MNLNNLAQNQNCKPVFAFSQLSGWKCCFIFHPGVLCSFLEWKVMHQVSLMKQNPWSLAIPSGENEKFSASPDSYWPDLFLTLFSITILQNRNDQCKLDLLAKQKSKGWVKVLSIIYCYDENPHKDQRISAWQRHPPFCDGSVGLPQCVHYSVRKILPPLKNLTKIHSPQKHPNQSPTNEYQIWY